MTEKEPKIPCNEGGAINIVRCVDLIMRWTVKGEPLTILSEKITNQY